MTEKPRKKMGRPATGRDRAYSFRLPPQLVKKIEKLAKELGITHSEVIREAVDRGIDHWHGYAPRAGLYASSRPMHAAEIHEAGHAVAVINIGDGLLTRVKLKEFGAGFCSHKPVSPEQDLQIIVAGAVAQAKFENKTFNDIWKSRTCMGDRRSAKKIFLTQDGDNLSLENAVAHMTKIFEDTEIWNALCETARRLPNQNSISGDDFTRIFRLHLLYPLESRNISALGTPTGRHRNKTFYEIREHDDNIRKLV